MFEVPFSVRNEVYVTVQKPVVVRAWRAVQSSGICYKYYKY